MRGSDDCFAQIAGTYLNEERTGGGAPLVEGYNRRRVCCIYGVSDQSCSLADLKAMFSHSRNFDDDTELKILIVRIDTILCRVRSRY